MSTKQKQLQRGIRPIQFDPNTKFMSRRRFNSASALTATCSPQSICDANGLVCTATNSTAVGIASAVRIISVEIWGPPASTAGVSTVSIDWAPTGSAQFINFSAPTEISDTSTSAAYVPYVRARPPKGSAASFWQARTKSTGAVNTDLIFTINVPTGAVVDVLFEVVLADFGRSSAIPVTNITTGTNGAFAYACLDGVAGALQPTGVNFFV
jgi:hypothetical protein